MYLVAESKVPWVLWQAAGTALTLLQIRIFKDLVIIRCFLKFLHYINLSTWISKHSENYFLQLFIMPQMPSIFLSLSLTPPLSARLLPSNLASWAVTNEKGFRFMS